MKEIVMDEAGEGRGRTRVRGGRGSGRVRGRKKG